MNICHGLILNGIRGVIRFSIQGLSLAHGVEWLMEWGSLRKIKFLGLMKPVEEVMFYGIRIG